MHKQKGFTIVELIVVIVVIAILAAITLVGYSMVQKRANDTRRINDVTTLQKAIEIYASENGSFPIRAVGASSWATSNTYPDRFIEGLTGESAGMSALSEMLIDPINNSSYYYRYYVYPSSTGCDLNKSPFYVLQIIRMESGYGPSPTGTATNNSPDSPGWNCGPGNRDWDSEAAYTVGGYLH